MGKWSYTV